MPDVTIDEPKVGVFPVEADELKLIPTFWGAEEVAVEVKEPNVRLLEVVDEDVVPKVKGATEDVVFKKVVVDVVVPKDRLAAGADVVVIPFNKFSIFSQRNIYIFTQNPYVIVYFTSKL